jgi:hypothetical protein
MCFSGHFAVATEHMPGIPAHLCGGITSNCHQRRRSREDSRSSAGH